MSVLFSVPYALCSTRILTVFCGTGTPACALLISCGTQAPSPANLVFFCFVAQAPASARKSLRRHFDLHSWAIAKTAQNCQTSPKLFCSLQIACPTALQFGFFGNYQFWQLLTLPLSLPVQTPVPPGSRGQRSSPSLSTSLDLHSLHPPCR